MSAKVSFFFFPFSWLRICSFETNSVPKHSRTRGKSEGQISYKPQGKLGAKEMEAWVQSDKASTNVLTMQKSRRGFEWCWHIRGHCWPQRARSSLERDKTIWENAAEALDSLVNCADRLLCLLPRGHEPEQASSHLLDKQANNPKAGCPQGLCQESNFLGNVSIWETNTPIKTH